MNVAIINLSPMYKRLLMKTEKGPKIINRGNTDKKSLICLCLMPFSKNYQYFYYHYIKGIINCSSSLKSTDIRIRFERLINGFLNFFYKN